MLGWRILERGEYRLDMPPLSSDEEQLISAAEERFREATRLRQTSGREESEALVAELLRAVAQEKGLYLAREQEGYLGRVAFNHIYGFAFLEELVWNDEIEEISVIGPQLPVYVYLRKKGWKSVNACFEREKDIADMANRMARGLGRHITLQNPRLDAMLPDGSRMHASLGPVSRGEITIRKFRASPFSPRELVDGGTMDAGAAALLSVLMQCDCSIMVAGNTASGKTTTLNSLFSFVPANERVLVTEQTPEIMVPHPHSLRLVASPEMGISLKDLVYDSLRMRPDRVIVGEVRDRGEAEALFDVLLSGQARGSYATFHAQSASEALSRLRSFGVCESDLDAIDCMVIQRRMLSYEPAAKKTYEVRRVVEIAAVRGGSAEAVFRPGSPLRGGALLERAAGSFGMGKGEMAQEMERRRRLILKSGPSFADFFREVQAALFGLGTGDGGR